jgi:hypothetical protein
LTRPAFDNAFTDCKKKKKKSSARIMRANGEAGTEEDSPDGRMAWGSSGGYQNLPWLLGGRVKQSNSDGVWRVHVWRVRWTLEGRFFFPL